MYSKLYLASVLGHTICCNIGFVCYANKLYIANKNYNLPTKCILWGESIMFGTFYGFIFGIYSPVLYPAIFIYGIKTIIHKKNN